MKSTISVFQEGFEAAIPVENKGVASADLATASDSVFDSVTGFIQRFALAKNTEFGKGDIVVSNEDYNVDGAYGQIGNAGIISLVQECGITDPIRQRQACQAVAQVIAKSFSGKGKTGNTLFAEHRKKVTSFDATAMVASMESFFPENLLATIAPVVNVEDYGAGMSTIIPDLRMAISVAIMNFHNGITSRVVSPRVATEPIVQYKRTTLKVYNVADPEELDKELLDVSKSPKFLTNQLVKIEPLKANDTGTTSLLVADDILRFGHQVPILGMALDATKYGHGTLNRTDIIADGVKLDEVWFTINDGTTAEQFKVTVPVSNNRLVMINNAIHAGMRGATVEFPTILRKTTLKADGTASTLLASLGADEGLKVTIRMNVEINLRNGKVFNMGVISVDKHHTKDPLLVSAALNTLYGTLFAAGKEPALVGYSLDARYDEQNLRKSQTATRLETRPFVFPLPPGKNYILDSAIGQSEEENGASSLVNVIKIGQDDKTLDTIESFLKQVYDMGQNIFLNPLQPGVDPGMHYVAGSLVKPRVKVVPFDLTATVESMKDSDLASDVRSNIQIKLSYLIEELLQETMYIAQLPAGQRPTFRVITSSKILNTLFAVEHIHNHMSNHQFPNYDGIEYRRVLDSGVTLEFVTSLFDYMYDKIMIIPVIPGAPDSILNWGHNWDHGTLIGNYNHSTETATWNRMFASTREITLPTNPMGILITVTNIDKALKAII